MATPAFRGAPKDARIELPTDQDAELFRAVVGGDIDRVQQLLRANADVTAKRAWRGAGTDETTALHLAAQHNRANIIPLLIEANIDVNTLVCRTRTALHEAARAGHEECVHLLLSLNSDIEAGTGSGTPLDAAVSEGHLDCTKALIKAQANVDIPGVFGQSILFSAAKSPNPAMLQFFADSNTCNFREKGIHDVSFNGSKLLHVAAFHARPQNVSLLVALRSDVNAPSGCDSTPLIEACGSYSTDHQAVLECVQALLAAEANPRVTDYSGNTCVHLAAKQGNELLLRLLCSLQHAALNVGQRNLFDEMPLILAVRSCQIGAVRTLVELKANVNDVYNKVRDCWYRRVHP